MIAEELHCTVTEAKHRVTPQEYLDKLTYWETHPPLRDHINICMAQISQSIFNTNLSRRQRAHKLDKFIIDYKKAQLPSRKKVDSKIRSILGAFAKG